MKVKVNSETDISAIPFCKECKHYHRKLSNVLLLMGHQYGRCRRIKSSQFDELDLVSGKIQKPKPVDNYAGDERADHNSCGPGAKFFTPKNKFGTFKLLKRKDF